MLEVGRSGSPLWFSLRRLPRRSFPGSCARDAGAGSDENASFEGMQNAMQNNVAVEAPLLNSNVAAVLYLISGVLFILALRGLSSPETSRSGNMFGMIGMAVAIG